MRCKGKVCGMPDTPPPRHKVQRVTGMQCRRCGKNLPMGHGNTCPFCGIRLDTYITPRNTSVKPRKPASRRNSLMSMLSVAFVVILVVIIVPVLQNNTKVKSETEIATLYAELIELRPELQAQYLAEKSGNWYEDDDWEIKINSLVAMIHKFKQDYPKETEKHAEYDAMITELMTPPNITEQSQFNEWAIANAKAEVVDILSITVGKPDEEGNMSLNVKIKNNSKETFSQVNIAFEALGAGGNPIYDGNETGENGEPVNLGYIHTNDYLIPGGEQTYTFKGIWKDPNIAAARVHWLQVEFSNGNTHYFPPEVSKEIWK